MSIFKHTKSGISKAIPQKHDLGWWRGVTVCVSSSSFKNNNWLLSKNVYRVLAAIGHVFLLGVCYVSIQFWTRRYPKSFPIFPYYFPHPKSFHYGLACMPPCPWQPSLINHSGSLAGGAQMCLILLSCTASPVVSDKTAFCLWIRIFPSEALLTAQPCSKWNLGGNFFSDWIPKKEDKSHTQWKQEQGRVRGSWGDESKGQRPLRVHSRSNFIWTSPVCWTGIPPPPPWSGA